MADLLDTNLRAVFNDDNGALLNRVVQSIMLDQGLDYMTALERFHAGTDSARASGTPTVRAAVQWGGGDPDYVAETVTLLERRDAVVQRAYEKAAGAIMLEQTDAQGMVLLDQGDAMAQIAGGVNPPQVPSGSNAERLGTDIGKVLGDPQEFERRLARIRAAQPGSWDVDEGREHFRRDDRLYAEAGKDLVRTAERPREIAAARAQAAQVAAQLDTAMRSAGNKRAKLKLLDAKIDELGGSAGEAARRELRSQMTEAARAPLMLLDQLSDDEPNGGVVMLGQPLSASKGGRPLSPKAREIAARINAQRPGDRDEYLRLLEQDESAGDIDRTAHTQVFLAAIELDPTPKAPDPAAEPELPPGVYAPSHGFHERVRERMVELDAPESSYPQILEQIVREGA
jgi:hypothetical protein